VPTIVIDTRERYPFRFTGKAAQTERVALAAGDYGVRAGEALIASVERKTFDNFAASLSDGTLAFQCQRLAELPAAAAVVEGKYSDLFRLEHVNGAWLADTLVRLQLRYPEIQVVSPTPGSSPRTGPTASCSQPLAGNLGSKPQRE
jgi:ERCC4-type nuclease